MLVSFSERMQIYLIDWKKGLNVVSVINFSAMKEQGL
jgi:hypothetical protein